MDNLIFALHVVFPISFIMVLGYLSRKLGWVTINMLNGLNRFLFRLPLPLLLFKSIYNIDTTHSVFTHEAIAVIALCLIGLTLMTIFSALALNLTKIEAPKKAVLVQAWFRGNLILFGLPVVLSMYGENGVGLVSTLLAFIIPLVNILAVLVLELYRGNGSDMKKLLISVLKNPILDGALIAAFFKLTHIELPELILTPLFDIAKTATPMAFIVLGGTLEFSKLRKNTGYILAGSLGRLVVTPAIIIGIALFLGMRGNAIGSLVGTIGAPVAVSSFTMAQEMDADGELAGQIVVSSTVLSILTIFFWVFIFKTLNLL